jgi:hypothetical protein
MAKGRQRLVPTVQGIERRALLSAGLAGSSGSAVVSAPPTETTLHLDGTFRGHYDHHQDNNLDLGTTFDLMGSGHAHGVGRAFVTGAVHTIGNIAQGHADGTLYLSGIRGTITLKLVGPEQDNGPKGLPDYFNYSVVGGTGQYRNVDDSGTASLVVIPGHSPAHAGDLDHGTFTLVLTSNANPTAGSPTA